MTRFDVSFAPIAVATRSGFDESLHHGAGVALAANGATLATVGDPDVVVYPRSCLKPMQAHAMVGLGLDLPDDELAVACSSHDGTPIHVAAVLGILTAHGLDENALQNTPSRPFNDPRSPLEPAPILQNCSGKHAAMLATCVINGWSVETYLDEAHPLQQAMVASLEGLGCSVAHIGIDGCGAPTHALSLRSLAEAFSVLASNESAVGRAMTGHPVMVGGVDRDTTIWMQSIPGLMAKDGAAGVMAVALDDGRAAAFKVADGAYAARQAVVPGALRALGIDVDDVTLERLRVPVLGHGHEVGHLDALEWTPWSS